MKKSIHLTILLLAALLYSCGGTIGNIEKYRFQNISTDSLKSVVKKVYIHHPELRQFDSIRFNEGKSGLYDGDFYCTIKDKEDDQKYFFDYAYVQYDPPNDGFVEISLAYAGKYGEMLKLERQLGFFEKRKYKRLFEENFISEVRKTLSKKSSNLYQ